MTRKTDQSPVAEAVPANPHISAIKAGRGNLGGSTILGPLSERAIYAGRSVLLADGDVRNRGLSQYSTIFDKYGFPRPASEESGELKRWYTDAFSAAIEKKASLIVDVGGGDRTLEEWANEDKLVQAADAMGLPVTGIFMCGPQPGDIEYLLSLWESQMFKPRKGIIVLNEWAVPVGHKPDNVFAPLYTDSRLLDVEGMDVAFLRIPKLTCMRDVQLSGLSFHDAAEGKNGITGKPLDPMRRWQVQNWLEVIEQNIATANITTWLP